MPDCVPKHLYHCKFLPAIQKSSNFFISLLRNTLFIIDIRIMWFWFAFFLMINNVIILSIVHVFIGFCRHASVKYLFISYQLISFAFSLALIFKNIAHLSAISNFPSLCFPCLFVSRCLLYNISLLVCLSVNLFTNFGALSSKEYTELTRLHTYANFTKCPC